MHPLKQSILKSIPLRAIFCLILALGVIWMPLDFLCAETASTSSGGQAPKTQVAPASRTQNASGSKTTTGSKGAAQPENVQDPLGGQNRPSLLTTSVVLSFLALMPFIIMILSSFLKIVVVLSLLRTALGVQQAPPNQIINGVALMLSLYVMYPTMLKMYDEAQVVINQYEAPETLTSKESATYILAIAKQVKEPLRDFILKNSSPQHQVVFYRTVYRVLPPEHRDQLKPEDFIIIVPAFITSQLKAAFEIGVLIYIPFFVIDLVTSNILLAMGMMMLSPVTISMPLKLFLLVMLDGWTLLIEGLVSTFLH